MSKSDFPALRMVVENGRLVPATPFDQERVNSYRRGAIVMCKLNEERDRVLVRKWFAIITLVVKQCQTPWKTKEDASEAIKLALGIVNLSKTVGGAFMQYPKSLTELDDPEMTEALEQMIELLSHMTGVDVETLNKEAADVGREIDKQDTNSASADLAPSGQSPDNDETAPVSSQEDGGEVFPPSASSPSSSILTDADRRHLMDFARKAFRTATDRELAPAKRTSFIDDMRAALEGEVSPDAYRKSATIQIAALKVCENPADVAKRRDFIARDLLECSVQEIGG